MSYQVKLITGPRWFGCDGLGCTPLASFCEAGLVVQPGQEVDPAIAMVFISHPIFSWKKWALVKRTYNAISIQYKKVKLASTVQTDNGAFVSSLLGALSSISGSAAIAFPANPTCGSCKGHFDMSGLHCTRPSFKKLSNPEVIGNPMLNVGIVRPLATSKVLHHIIISYINYFLFKSGNDPTKHHACRLTLNLLGVHIKLWLISMFRIPTAGSGQSCHHILMHVCT